jgi:spore coat polysaccharide biosynthesis protein SpsF
MRDYATDQERFWAGEFGNDYIERNRGAEQLASRTAIFADILRRTSGVDSVLELGANIGRNLEALGRLLPECSRTGVEINEKAFAQLSALPGVRALHASIFDVDPAALGKSALCFTSGVLIHVAPERLADAYRVLHECSSRYVCVMEYYSPTPVEVRYRGHEEKLFKRDFAGELLDTYPDLRLVDYAFVYHRDPSFAADDLTWFLMQKAG